MNKEEFNYNMLLIVVPITLLICGCVIVLKVAENVSNNLRPLNSLSVYEDSCYVYGDNVYFATMCMNYMEDSNNTNYTYNDLRLE
jgi:hypothetical protein